MAMSQVSVLDKLTDVTFAVIDIETTGFDMKGVDRICEVAVVRGRLGVAQPVDSWSSLVNPGRNIPYGASQSQPHYQPDGAEPTFVCGHYRGIFGSGQRIACWSFTTHRSIYPFCKPS